MAKITRDQLLEKRKEVLAKIDTLTDEIRNAKYNTNRYYEGFGVVESMSKDTLVAATSDLKARMHMTSEVLDDLGFDAEKEEKTYLGYTFEEWMNDFKTRAKVIRNEDKVSDLYEALTIIEDNLSEDDRFSLEMENLAALL